MLAEQLTAFAMSAAQLFRLLASGLYCNLPDGGDGLVLIVVEDPLEEGMATRSNILARRILMDKRSMVGYSP